MKQKALALLVLLMSLFCAVPCLAEDRGTATYDYDATIFPAYPSSSLKSANDSYNTSRSACQRVVTGVYSKYFVPIQPISVIPFVNSTITLDEPIPNYTSKTNIPICAWDLPVLKDQYYYVLEDNNYLTLPDYAYPVLVLKNKPSGEIQNVSLSIYERADESSTATSGTLKLTVRLVVPFNLATDVLAEDEYYISDHGTLKTADMAVNGTNGNDYWAFNYDFETAGGLFYYPYQTNFAVFGDDYVVVNQKLINDNNYAQEFTALAENYNLSITNKDLEQEPMSYSSDTADFDGFLTSMPSSLSKSISVYNAYGNEMYATSGATKVRRHMVYAIAPKQDILYTRINPGDYTHTKYIVGYTRNDYEVVHGATAAFFTPGAVHFVVMKPGAIDSVYTNMDTTPFDSVTEVLPNTSATLRRLAGGYYYVIPLDVQSVEDQEKDDYSLGYNEYGEPTMLMNQEMESDHNLAALNVFGAWKPSVGAFGTGAVKHYTLKFDSTGGTACDDLLVTMHSDAPTLPTPQKTKYNFMGWYTDSSCKMLYNYDNFKAVASGEYTLYAKWEKITGTYYVKFIDSVNNTTSTGTYNTSSQPTLPATPTAIGYKFKCWTIVENEDATVGTIYDPTTFAPEIGVTYIFKATYDVTGVITSVAVSKYSYYVGQAIDKGTMSVTVQTANDGTTKVLTPSEFTITPTIVESEGTQQVTITYPVTGATATINLTGLPDELESISATYTGTALVVGTKIPSANIKVTGTYKSGVQGTLTSFSISPSTVTSTGDNTITITASGLSTSLTIPGKSSSSSTEKDASKVIRSITATYSGPVLYVGDVVNSGDFRVQVVYNDGSTKTLSNGEFTVSPKKMSSGGRVNVTVSYAGYTTSVPIDVIEKSGDDIQRGDNKYGTNPTTTLIRNPDGTTTTTTTDPSGKTTTYTGQSNTGSGTVVKTETNADGSKTYYYADGTSYTENTSASTDSLEGYDDPLINNAHTPLYLNGMTIEDSQMLFDTALTPDSLTNIADRLEEYKNQMGEPLSLSFNLNNGAANNWQDASVLETIKKAEKWTVYINMVDYDSGDTLGKWELKSERMTASMNGLDPNITIRQFNRTNGETIVKYATNNNNIPEYTTLTYNLDRYFNPQQSIMRYATTFDNYNAEEDPDSLQPITYQGASIPIESGPVTAYTFTDEINHRYDYNVNFEQQPTWATEIASSEGDSSNDMSDQNDSTTTEETGWDDVTTEEPQGEDKKSIPLPFILIGALVALSAIGGGVFLVLRHRSANIPPANISPSEFDEYEGVEYDDMEEYDDTDNEYIEDVEEVDDETDDF